MDGRLDKATIRRRVEALLHRRDPASSICPSDVVRSLCDADDESWRGSMSLVREVAAEMARAGILCITRGHQTLDAANLKGGPIRLRRGPRFAQRDPRRAGGHDLA